MIDPTRFTGSDQDVHGLLGKQQILRSEATGRKRKAAETDPIPKHEPGGRFVRGPIPFDWLGVALALGGKAGNLVFAIWWLAGVERSNPIRMTARVLRDFHISPRAARRLLVDFERAGLVALDRRRGRGPLVTILALRSNETTGDEKLTAQIPQDEPRGRPLT